MATPTLVGREAETARLRTLVAELPRAGAALVVRGEAGVGKSSLLDVAARQAEDAGLAVLRVTGVEAEAQVPFSGLHRLLEPVLPAAEALPRRQREALLSAFGMAEPVVEPYLVGYAALELITDHAAQVPVVVVVDDVQWLDPATAAALAFVARRVAHEPVAALFALRDRFDSPLSDGSIPDLVVPALDAHQSSALVDRHAAHLSGPARERILELADGNPLALVELSRAWSSTDSGAELTDGPLPARLERAFARRVATLPEDTRLAALVAAADDSDDLAEVVAATARLTGSAQTGDRTGDRAEARAEDLLAAAVDAGVLVVDGTKVRFHHPLSRSACYQGALPSQRRAAHAALAEVLAASPERRTWHRAAAALGPADEIAAELESAAVAASERGSAQVAVAALARAADLSASEVERGRRLTGAAELAFDAGLHERGADLLERAAASSLAEDDRLRVSWLKEWFGDPGWSGAEKVSSLCRMARGMADRGSVDRGMKVLLEVALRCWWSEPDDATARTLVEAAEALAPGTDEPTLVTVLAYGAPVERGRVVVERIASFAPESLERPVDALNLGTAATGVGAFPLAAPLLESAVVRFRARGQVVHLLRALLARMLTDFHLGRWDAARAAGDEVRRLAVDTSQPLWGMAAASTECLVAAAQGDDEGLDSLGRTAEAFFLPLGAHTFVAPVEMARGCAAYARGDHDEALHHFRRVSEPDSAVHHRHARHWVAPDHVGAALALGRRDEARRIVGEMESLWEVTGSPLLGASLLVTRPLVADAGRAESLFAEGLTKDLAQWPFHHGRHLLGYGAWLRRHRRARESRAFLRQARDVFDALGAARWYERATRELRASGETSRERAVGARNRLSPQELQIAQLAASGLSNREIGQHLYLSHRTVGSHLYRIFPKLGITSRAQLDAALRRAVDVGGAAPG